MKRVLIAAPLRQKPEIFAEFQKSLDNLIIPAGVEADRFWLVNDCPEVIPVLRNCKYIEENFNEEHRAHLWTAPALERMFVLRDAILEYAILYGYDYVLSADTDLVLMPQTIAALLQTGKDIVAEVFWTDDPKGAWCNAWMYDQADTAGMQEKWHGPGIYPVGMAGALMLISRRAIEAGCRYRKIPNIRTALFGEDRHFSVRAACAGYQIWLDTRYPARHLYDDAAYENYMEETYGRTFGKSEGSAADHQHGL